MMLSRLTSHFVKATRLTGCFVPLCGNVCHKSTSASYSTRRHHQKPQISPHTWYNFQPELDDVLVPRMMSISPLESLLTSRFYLPQPDAPSDHEELQENLEYYECPTEQSAENVGEGRENAGEVQCKNVLKIRRRKMNKHKYRKLLKRTKFVRQKVNHNRNKRKQAKFEKDLERIWKKAGLKKAPDGWHTPKIYVKY